MIKSMTAFARGAFSSQGRHYCVEIQSVNRKSLEVAFHVPREFFAAEIPLKKKIAEKTHRGQIVVRIVKEQHPSDSLHGLPTVETLKALKESLITLAKEIDVPHGLTLPLLLSMADKTSHQDRIEDEVVFLADLDKGFETCLEEFVLMKQKEGKELVKDFLKQLTEIEVTLALISAESLSVKERFEKRLHERIKEIGTPDEIDADRLAKEVALLGEKIDVNEEITRLSSHCLQFKELLSSEEERVGRTLDFLIQEMNREANTIASKSQELSITQAVVQIKSTLDKLREQVQNIE